MDELFHQLPAWGAVLAVVAYILIKEVVPRINRAHRPPASLLPPPVHHPVAFVSPPLPVSSGVDGEDVIKQMDRFEAALERHFENDKQQFELLRMTVAQLEIQGHMLQEATGVLQEIKSTLKILSNTQDVLFRRILEDTGRHHPLRPDRG